MEIRHDVRHVTGRACVCVCVCAYLILSIALWAPLSALVCAPLVCIQAAWKKSIVVTSTRLELITPSIRQYGRPTGGIRAG